MSIETKSTQIAPVDNEIQAALLQERDLQIDTYIHLGFHTVLGLSEEEYRASFPNLFPQPQEYKGFFDIPIWVDPRIPLETIYNRVGIQDWINYDPQMYVENPEPGNQFMTPNRPIKIINTTDVPDTPYAAWSSDGRRFESQSVPSARRQFRNDEVGSPLVEVVALYLQYSGGFLQRGIDAPGSQTSMGQTPGLHTLHHGIPRVNSYGVHEYSDGNRNTYGDYKASALLSWSVMTRGKKIAVK